MEGAGIRVHLLASPGHEIALVLGVQWVGWDLYALAQEMCRFSTSSQEPRVSRKDSLEIAWERDREKYVSPDRCQVPTAHRLCAGTQLLGRQVPALPAERSGDVSLGS